MSHAPSAVPPQPQHSQPPVSMAKLIMTRHVSTCHASSFDMRLTLSYVSFNGKLVVHSAVCKACHDHRRRFHVYRGLRRKPRAAECTKYERYLFDPYATHDYYPDASSYLSCIYGATWTFPSIYFFRPGAHLVTLVAKSCTCPCCTSAARHYLYDNSSGLRRNNVISRRPFGLPFLNS